VPLLGGTPGQQYRMVGIPDGLGAHPNHSRTSTLYMNHELGFTALSEPVVGGPTNRGAIVSKWILDADGDPVAGRRAYDRIYAENAPRAGAGRRQRGADTRQFARFRSAFLAGPENGFDRRIYPTNEESTGEETFDGKGGLSVAIFDDQLRDTTSVSTPPPQPGSPNSTRPAATVSRSAQGCGRPAASSTHPGCSALTPGSPTSRRTRPPPPRPARP
jgi:hypothetical protein